MQWLTADSLLLALLFLAAAVLYSSVGHAGASGYLAAMALVAMTPAQMKPTALCLNIVVAVIATARYARAGCFKWRLFWPFALASVPLAAVGGAMRLPSVAYKPIVALALLVAAWRLALDKSGDESELQTRQAPVPGALAWGAGIGLLSGLTGIGGGIFLSPLLIFMKWARLREAAGVSAAFILANSISGLMGHVANVQTIPKAVWLWAPTVAVGGLMGGELGARRLNTVILRRTLAAVLFVAAGKMLLTLYSEK